MDCLLLCLFLLLLNYRYNGVCYVCVCLDTKSWQKAPHVTQFFDCGETAKISLGFLFFFAFVYSYFVTQKHFISYEWITKKMRNHVKESRWYQIISKTGSEKTTS